MEVVVVMVRHGSRGCHGCALEHGVAIEVVVVMVLH